jgi:ankyrin repeat protein
VNEVVAYVALFLLASVFGGVGISALLAFLKNRSLTMFLLGAVALGFGITAAYFGVNRQSIQREQKRIDDFVSAAGAGDLATVRQMLSAHPELANVEQVGSISSHFAGAHGQTMFVVNRPLRAAAEGLHDDVVALLLERGADPNGKIDGGETPLHAVGNKITYDDDKASARRAKIIDLLIGRGANVNARKQGQATPLIENAHDPKAVERLLAHAADVNARDESGRTPLLSAATPVWDTSESVKQLLDHGADILARDNEGRTAVLHAATSANLPVLDLLISRGAPAKAIDRGGDNVLHTFATYDWLSGLRSYDALALLCSCGLHPDARNHAGKRPVEILRDRERTETDPARRKQFEQTSHFLAQCDRFASVSKEQRNFIASETACADGVADGCARLAWCYDTGTGTAVNRSRAADLYKLACDAGKIWTCYNLGILYEQGDGVAKDRTMAITFYRKACDAGDADACKKTGT